MDQEFLDHIAQLHGQIIDQMEQIQRNVDRLNQLDANMLNVEKFKKQPKQTIKKKKKKKTKILPNKTIRFHKIEEEAETDLMEIETESQLIKVEIESIEIHENEEKYFVTKRRGNDFAPKTDNKKIKIDIMMDLSTDDDSFSSSVDARSSKMFG